MSVPRLRLTPEGDLTGQVLIRRAAKAHNCAVARIHARGGSANWIPAEGCTPVIAKGDRYVEYLGEAAAYESGTRYCAACACKHLSSWVVSS